MENKNIEVVKPNALSGLVEMKVSQTDLLNLVVQMQIEKVEAQLNPVVDALKVQQNAYDVFKKDYQDEIIKVAVKALKKPLDAFGALYPEVDLYFTFQNPMSRGDRYSHNNHNSKLHNTVFVIAVKKGNELKYRNDDKGNILSDNGGYATMDALENSLYTINYKLDEKFYNSKTTLFEDIKTSKENLEKKKSEFENQIAEIKKNEGKMNAKMVKTFLEQSEEGKVLMENLSTMTFDSTKLLN